MNERRRTSEAILRQRTSATSHPMPRALKRNAVIVFGLAAVFSWSFMFAKHNPALRTVIPFGDDPYDAVGSFGVIVGVLISLLSLVRAFRPYRNPPSSAQCVYLVRSQHAVVLAVLITVGADVIAMARHPGTWTGTSSRNELIVLLAGLAVVGVGVQRLIQVSQPEAMKSASTAAPWGKASLLAVLAILVLALYPERLTEHLGTHLATVLVGDLVLFAPMPLLLISLVPYRGGTGQIAVADQGRKVLSARRRWGLIVVLGLMIGVWLFLAEVAEPGTRLPPNRLLFVGAVYAGLTIAGLLVAYGLLGGPLGVGAEREANTDEKGCRS